MHNKFMTVMTSKKTPTLLSIYLFWHCQIGIRCIWYKQLSSTTHQNTCKFCHPLMLTALHFLHYNFTYRWQSINHLICCQQKYSLRLKIGKNGLLGLQSSPRLTCCSKVSVVWKLPRHYLHKGPLYLLILARGRGKWPNGSMIITGGGMAQ